MTPALLQSPENERARIRARTIIGVWTVYAIISLNQSYIWAQINDQPFNTRRVLAFTLTLCISWCAYTPLIIWAARRFPVGRAVWQASFLPHVALSTVFGMVDVLVDRTIGPHFGFERSPNYWSGFIGQWDMNVFYYAVIVASVTAADFYAM